MSEIASYNRVQWMQIYGTFKAYLEVEGGQIKWPLKGKDTSDPFGMSSFAAFHKTASVEIIAAIGKLVDDETDQWVRIRYEPTSKNSLATTIHTTPN